MLPYIGNKVKLNPFILRNLPLDNTWDKYVEPFGGMYSTYFSIHRSDITSVYNDINKLNSNLFECMKDPEFTIYINSIPTSKELYYKYQSEVTNHFITPNLEMGMKWAYVLANSLSQQKVIDGAFRAGGWQAYKIHLNKISFKEKIKNISNIESIDFIDCLNRHDSDTTLFYLDPPYFNTENYYHFHNFTKDRHIDLSKALNIIKGKFCLSYYYNPIIEDLYPDNIYRWEWNTKNGSRDEILIMNY